MAATPSLINASAINGVTDAVKPSTTSETSILSNASASGIVYRITKMTVTNIDTSNAVACTIAFHTAAALGGSTNEMCSAVQIPANSTLEIVKDGGVFYLNPDQSLGITAGSSNKLVVVYSGEKIT